MPRSKWGNRNYRTYSVRRNGTADIRVWEESSHRPPVMNAISKSMLLKFQHIGVAHGDDLRG